MNWTFFEAALGGAATTSAALEALTASFLPELGETLAAIGAEEAAPLLGEARTAAEPAERQAKLEAALDVIDQALDVYSPLARTPLQGLGSVDDWDGAGAELGDVARVALLAVLVHTELGGDTGSLGRRASMARTANWAHFASQQGRRSEKDRRDDRLAGDRVFTQVLQLIVTYAQPRRPKSRFGRRK